MNTNPDETLLALWLDDELHGAELTEMEAWAADKPEQMAAREKLRSFRAMVAENIPASEEPPYPDFFLTRIQQGIRDSEVAEIPAKTAAAPAAEPFWKAWLMPLAACAGMVLAFGIGKKSHESNQGVAGVPSFAPVVYTPEEGVDAEWFSSSPAGATVIVLEGIAAIPDATDFSQTVYVPTARESDRVAGSYEAPLNSSQQ